LPRREKHKTLCESLLGDGYEDVHRWMDAPSKKLGVKHRRVRHSVLDAIMVGLTTGDPLAGVAALLHIWQDIASSAVKDYERSLYKPRRRARRGG